MAAQDILLAAIVILVPLSIAVAVTLWTLQPAALRAERAKRSQRRAAERAAASSAAPESSPAASTESDQNDSH